MRLQQTLEKYLPLIGNMLAPAFIFAGGLFCFLLYGSFDFSISLTFHWAYYSLCLLSLIILLNFNQSRPLFFLSAICLSYILINYLKNRFGAEFSQTVWFNNLIVLLPWNLLAFYLYPGRRFLSRRSLIFLLSIMAEYAAAEFLGRYQISLSLVWHGVNLMAACGFVVLISWALVYSVKAGKLYDYSILFASICISLGLYFASSAAGLSLFFFMAQLIVTINIIYSLVYNHYYDEMTGVYSRNSYLMQSKHFPLKYSLGIVSIDNYDKLAETIGAKRQKILTALVAEVLQELAAEDAVYRYAPEQFIIIYKKFDKKEAFAHLENIRRTIASLSFACSTAQKPLKLTVSCSVSEKKRSDAGAVEVLLRADKAMRKTLKFSHNVTSQG